MGRCGEPAPWTEPLCGEEVGVLDVAFSTWGATPVGGFPDLRGVAPFPVESVSAALATLGASLPNPEGKDLWRLVAPKGNAESLSNIFPVSPCPRVSVSPRPRVSVSPCLCVS